MRRYLEKRQCGRNEKYLSGIRQKIDEHLNKFVNDKENLINKHFSNTLSVHELDDSFTFPQANVSRISTVNNHHDDSIRDGTNNWANRSCSSQNDSKLDSFTLNKRRSSYGKDNSIVNHADKENSYSYKYLAKKKKNSSTFDMPFKSGSASTTDSSHVPKFVMNEI